MKTVIRQSKKGRKYLETDYDFNKISWIKTEICEKCIKKLDKHDWRESPNCLPLTIVTAIRKKSTKN